MVGKHPHQCFRETHDLRMDVSSVLGHMTCSDRLFPTTTTGSGGGAMALESGRTLKNKRL